VLECVSHADLSGGLGSFDAGESLSQGISVSVKRVKPASRAFPGLPFLGLTYRSGMPRKNGQNAETLLNRQ
ncbi:hypothetical protein, partial [Arthrobacter sp. UYCo732]|uniref:hypothetical protein n=1 Tax=Arthrobacter sp. UYCo732 TaxID=3156336 RepID=UPI0033940C68